ncbi:hypothetical protein [Larkinella humicola]|uniref:Uncharacterized protein n=1 Tax=Larkinella humicola TaxID=2607654 RepID=A0A5N1JE86_9BACT|nr:hypothetical protein [Larkinella humicola]KAA9353425.1 hypothetical protein F0P93_12310 [Larkinella humicola]
MRLTSTVSGLSLLVWGLLCGQTILLAIVQTMNDKAVCPVDHGLLCDVYMGIPSHEKRGKMVDSSPPRGASATAEKVAPGTIVKILKMA